MPISEPSLVRSKLLMPSPAGLLHRPQVCQAIEQGLDCKLTIVSAPAGYGKTSALVDFAQHSPMPVCWYTADERDRDLGGFIEYLVGAIRERFPDFGARTLEALASESGALLRDPTRVVGEISNEMLETDTPFAVVVDNYESVDGASGIRAFVHRLLEVLPSNSHLMIGSRVLPDVPITRLVARRQLVGLTARELHFTPHEIQSLLQLSQIKISENQAQAIAADSEGWITGILLLASRLRQETQAILLDGEKATAQTYEYLIREVLLRQPPDIQHFLCTSAMLREMSSRLCREIMQIRDPSALLAEVERRNLFVTRFGRGNGATYRYHNLFRDFLHEQLRQLDPILCAELHQRAANWFEQANHVEEAVYHYLAAGAYPEATVLMERVAMEWFTRGRVETLIHWGEELPREVRAQAPNLLLYHSKVLTDRYDYDRVRQALADAEIGFAVRKDRDLLAKVHNQRATLGFFEGRYEDTISEAQTALDMLSQDEVMERAAAQRHIGRAYVGLGRFAEGLPKLQEALALYRQAGSLYNVVNLLQDLVYPLTAQGRLDEVKAYLDEALIIGRRLGAPRQLAGVLNELGWVRYLCGQYRDALELYEEGLAAARRGGDLRYHAYILAGMADVYRDVGAYERAEPLYDASWRIARENEPGLALYILAARADMYRWRGDFAQALSLLKQAHQLAGEKGLDFERCGPLPVAEGITLVENDEIETGLRLLSEGVRFLEQRQATRDLARGRFLLAKAHLLAGDKSEAVAELHHALDLAEKTGTHQFAVVEGQHAGDLLSLGIAEGIPPCHIIIEEAQQLRNFGKAQEQVVIGAEEGAVSHLEIYTLGNGQLVVDGRTVSASEWQTAVAKELFFYILFHGPLERDTIGATFWPELPLKKMTNRFHITLHRIRRALGGDVVVKEEGRYGLGNVDYWLDVEEFMSLVERARLLPPHDWQTENLWRRATMLYQGDFLPDVERVWCVPMREALREMFLEALIGVGRCYETRREYEAAIGWYRQGLEVDELREDIHRRIMQCYLDAGQRAGALAQFHRCREVLRQGLDARPSTETHQLYQRIAGHGPD